MGAVSLIGSDDILACFIAGNSFNWDDWFRVETAKAYFQDIIDLLLNLAVFIYLGIIIPWPSFNEEALGLSYWRLIVVTILILLFRRLPVVMAFLKAIPTLKTRREGILTGWFGPIGVATIFYAQVAKGSFLETDAIHAHARELIVPVTFFLVISSITIYGISVPLIKIGKLMNKLIISRNQSFRQDTNTPEISNTVSRASSTTFLETRNNDLDKSKTIVTEKEHSPPITTNLVVQDDVITQDVTIDVNTKENI